mgnify:CR=1 FL=1
MIESAEACTGPAAEYRTWTTAFVTAPMAFSVKDNTLVFANRIGNISFKRS